MDFTKEYKNYLTKFQGYLQEYLSSFDSLSVQLTNAIKYALLGGGKRLRPVLFLAIYEHFAKTNAEEDLAKKISLAVELLHNYTLIHDDLPCLDDDDYRRGRLSCHKKFGEAVALLAGDSLLNESYNLLFECCFIRPDLVKTIQKFCFMSGHSGLIGGQAKELEAFGQGEQKITEELFLEIYKNKTAALFIGSALLGAAAAGENNQDAQLTSFAQNFGLAFQLKDDYSDNNKESFTYHFGKQRTKELIFEFSDKAKESAKAIGSEFLLKLIDFEKYL